MHFVKKLKNYGEEKFMENNLETIERVLYQTDEGAEAVEVLLVDETLWASQKIMADLFGVDRSVITKHLRNIFKEEELLKDSVCAKIAHTADDGKVYNTQFYNLDAVIAVGYRVNSKKATHFRKWATQILKEYMLKGFVLDDDLLKNGGRFGKDYFEELLERIREIRASERRFYQKVTDIFKDCSYDYNKNSETARVFYAKVQNKLHYAVTRHTAAELIYGRADHEKDNMGLTNWGNAPDGKIIKKDTGIAKNYLSENELSELNALVNMYLDYAELQAKRHNLMSMEDWAKKLDGFLEFNEYGILDDNGNISMNQAKNKANLEYDKFRLIQDKKYQSDFDKLLEQTRFNN